VPVGSPPRITSHCTYINVKCHNTLNQAHPIQSKSIWGIKIIKIERIYKTHSDDGFRILVDRLWPRGLSKEKANLDLWLKDIAPSEELRKWFGHDPGRWDEFKDRFFLELNGKKELVDLIAKKANDGDVIPLFAAKDEVHNNATALKEYLESKMKK